MTEQKPNGKRSFFAQVYKPLHDGDFFPPMLVDQRAGSVPSISDDVYDAVSKNHLSSRRRQVSSRPYGSTFSATSFW